MNMISRYISGLICLKHKGTLMTPILKVEGRPNFRQVWFSQVCTNQIFLHLPTPFQLMLTIVSGSVRMPASTGQRDKSPYLFPNNPRKSHWSSWTTISMHALPRTNHALPVTRETWCSPWHLGPLGLGLGVKSAPIEAHDLWGGGSSLVRRQDGWIPLS